MLARKAAERYREKTGARCNVLVCDDGLLCFAANDLEGKEPLILSVDSTGRFFLNLADDQAPLDNQQVLDIVGAALRREPERPVLVKADRTVEYGRVVEGMVLLQQACAIKVGFVTQPVDVGASREPRR